MINYTIAQEKIIYIYVRNDPTFHKHISSSFFKDPIIRKCYELDIKFYKKYSKVPSFKQLHEFAYSLFKDENPLTEDKLSILDDIKLTDYNIEWVERNAKTWIKANNILEGFSNAGEYAQTTNVTPDNVDDFINTVTSLVTSKASIHIDDDLGLNFFDAKDHKQPTEDRFSSGWKYLDDCLNGGFSKKELYCILGGTKKGKSLWLANIAANAVRNGNNVVYASFELSDSKVVMRLGSNILNIKMDEYEELSHDEELMNKKLNDIKKGDGFNLSEVGNLYVKEFGTSTTSVPELEAYILNLEKTLQINMDLIVIDYINIMKNWRNPNTEHTYMKLKQIAEDMRAMVQRNNWTGITVSQVNRAGQDSSDVTTSDVSESTGLLHTVDACFAIMQDPAMKNDGFYHLKSLILRNSSASNTRKRFDINYDYLRITESDEDVIDIDSGLFPNQRSDNRQATRRIESRDNKIENMNSIEDELSPLGDNDFFG